MNLTPEQMQEAIAQYLLNQPQDAQPQTRRVPPNPVTIPGTMGGYQTASNDYGFKPYEDQEMVSSTTTQQPTAPEMVLANMEQDLANCLQHAIQVNEMELLTPENIFLQQILRKINRMEKVVAALSDHLASKEVEAPQQLIFSPEKTEEENDIEEQTVPTSKKVSKTRKRTTRVRKGSRAPKRTRKDGD